MKKYQLLPLLALPLLFAASSQATTPTANKKPNILLIVGDDLGYSDLGVFGSEIRTPNLDALAKTGKILKNFYSQPTCSPTRSELFSGTDHHLAGVGSMLEELAPEQVGQPGYEGVLADRVAPLSYLLKDAGYNTYLAGKWHLGAAPDHRPGARGFDKSFALLPGGASHFKQTTQRLFPDTPEPKYTENDQIVQLPDNFFSTVTYTDKLIEYIDSGIGSNKPFFAYAAYTAPHWPIQAPDANLNKVRGRYNAGYDVIAKQRFNRQKQLGIVAHDAQQPPLPAGVKPWNQLSAAEQAKSARTYEAYAAAVEALDDNVGRLVQHLKDIGEYDNTFIVFFADNGAEGNNPGKSGVSAQPLTGQQAFDQFNSWIASNFDNSLDNIGRKNSYVSINEAWGQTSALPNNLYKGFTTEGGVHTPALISFPKLIKPGKASSLVTVRDILPTLLEVAGTQHPGVAYQGRTVLPVQGISVLPYLTGNDTAVHSYDTPVGFELFGRSALRKGSWKIVRLYPPVGDGSWHLYNLEKDPTESFDLVKIYQLDQNGGHGLPAGDDDDSGKLLGKFEELKRDWQAYVKQNNVIELGYDYGYGWIDDSLIK